jgi:IS66 C-terminal element
MGTPHPAHFEPISSMVKLAGTGCRSAVIYSIVGTCRVLKVDPLAYLTWVLPKLDAAANKTETGLLPHDYARLQSPPNTS